MGTIIGKSPSARLDLFCRVMQFLRGNRMQCNATQWKPAAAPETAFSFSFARTRVLNTQHSGVCTLHSRSPLRSASHCARVFRCASSVVCCVSHVVCECECECECVLYCGASPAGSRFAPRDELVARALPDPVEAAVLQHGDGAGAGAGGARDVFHIAEQRAVCGPFAIACSRFAAPPHASIEARGLKHHHGAIN